MEVRFVDDVPSQREGREGGVAVVGTEARTTVATYSKLCHVALVVVVAGTEEVRTQCVFVSRSSTGRHLATALGGTRIVHERLVYVLEVLQCTIEVHASILHRTLTCYQVDGVLVEGLVPSQHVLQLPYSAAVARLVGVGDSGLIVS